MLLQPVSTLSTPSGYSSFIGACGVVQARARARACVCAREHVLRHTRRHRGLTRRGPHLDSSDEEAGCARLGRGRVDLQEVEPVGNSIRCNAAPHVATQDSMLQHGCPLGLGCKSCAGGCMLGVARFMLQVAFCQPHDACRVFHALHVAAKHAGGLFPSMHCMSAVVCCCLLYAGCGPRAWAASAVCVYWVPLSLKLSKTPSS
jgi:hypothetical protein